MKTSLIFVVIFVANFLAAKCDYQKNHKFQSPKKENNSSISSSCEYSKNEPYLGLKCKQNFRQFLEITEISPNSPADLAEFEQGDQIISINNKLINNEQQFSKFINNLQIDKVIFIKILRDEQIQVLPLRVGCRC